MTEQIYKTAKISKKTGSVKRKFVSCKNNYKYSRDSVKGSLKLSNQIQVS